MVSDGSTSRVIVWPVSVFAKICIIEGKRNEKGKGFSHDVEKRFPILKKLKERKEHSFIHSFIFQEEWVKSATFGFFVKIEASDISGWRVFVRCLAIG